MAVSSSSWAESGVTGLSQRTHVHVVSPVTDSGATRLLDLAGLAVREVLEDAGGGRVVHVVTAGLAASACPSCGVISTSTKGRVVSRPRDIGYGTSPLRLVWHKRRWRCAERLCARGSFTEQVDAVPARARLSVRLRGELAHAVAQEHRCVAEVAAHYLSLIHISEPTRL